VIELHDVYFRYPGSDWVLKGIDLTIGPGEYILVCGANGSGKSTLGCLLNGLIPHFIDGELAGSVSIEGCDTRQLNVADLASSVGLVLQNAEAQLFHSTVADDIAFGLETSDLEAEDIDARVVQVAASLHIEHLLERPPAKLSGGEKRLAAIATVLALGPSIIVLDEPFADLDWEGVALVREELRHIHQSGKTVVVIEQRLRSVVDEATRCLILEEGELSFDGSPKEAAVILYEKRLIPRYPERKPPRIAEKGSMLVARSLHSRRNGKEILSDISFEIKSGESVAVIGKNGAGKTTLVKHFNALMRPSQGTVTLLGEEIDKEKTNTLAALVGLSFQNPNDQFFKIRVRDELMVGPRMLKRVDEEWIERVRGLFQLNELLERSPYRLSEGEKKRVALAAIFVMKSRLVVLDEPTVGQDGQFKEALIHFLRFLEECGFTLVIVTHDLDFARAATDRWIVLRNGRIVADGSPQCIFETMDEVFSENFLSHLQKNIGFDDDTLRKAALG